MNIKRPSGRQKSMKPEYTLLQQARKWTKKGDNDEILKLWRGNPQLIHKHDAFGKTVFHYAAETGLETTIRLLIRLGAIPDEQVQSPSLEHPRAECSSEGRIGQTALHFASELGHLHIVILL